MQRQSQGATTCGLAPLGIVFHTGTRLTLLSGEKHAILQGELNAHLRSVTKKLPGGEVVDMMPRRGNAGKLVRWNFTPEERLNALNSFYRGFAEGRYYVAFRMELNAALAKGMFK